VAPHAIRGKHEEGFTLLEAVVSLAIFGVGTIALLSLAPRATQFTSRGQQVSKAAQLAQAKVEDLLALPSTATDLDAGTHEDTANPIDGVYARQWTVTADNPIQGMSRVAVRVSFPTASPDSVSQVVTYF
jgi:Tfp pilus assembly protein PilV